MSTTYQISRFKFRRETAFLTGLVVNTLLLLYGVYYLLSPNEIIGPVAILVPLVWISIGILAIVATKPPMANQRQRTIALAIATGYFGLIGYFGGIWNRSATSLPYGLEVTLFSAPPGWAPRIALNTPVVFLNLQPWQVIGYAALAYLIYVAVLEAAGSVISGIVGFLSCVSCTWPILATIVSSVVGGTGAAAGIVYDQTYLLSTVVFVITVALLYWRPGWK